ncbi:hypothetical protein AOQ84DRAFT_378950 [Glonium stellatum]|uniref:Uncharacterized protein n=1 Tax=Glonium stellatum TaxID=574774 RepID=A0A8E2EWF0_9PEZI|nr:hypothetical protein AOQ84DRAFT_378950 [Glonium stellatum]
MENKVNKEFIDVLRLFLEVLDMDTPETFGSKLKGYKSDDHLHNEREQKYRPFDLKTPVCIMDYILSKLPPETELEAVKKLRNKYDENKLYMYHCWVILSALVWLLQLFEPSQRMTEVWSKPRTKLSPHERSSFRWACDGAKRVDILQGRLAEERVQEYLKTLWDWFGGQQNSIFSFVFRISKIGVLRELSEGDLGSLLDFSLEAWGIDSDDC